MKLTTRQLYLLLLSFSIVLLATSFTLQFGFHLEPCPLCIIARIIVIFLTILFALALIQNPGRLGQEIYSVLGTLLSLSGILVNARHLWIIHLPPEEVPACGPGFQYLIDTLHPVEALMVILQGSGECAENNAHFLGLSLPAWTLIAFVFLTMACLYSWHMNHRKK
jgi:disulfide bond formation protein DsbB